MHCVGIRILLLLYYIHINILYVFCAYRVQYSVCIRIMYWEDSSESARITTYSIVAMAHAPCSSVRITQIKKKM